MSAKKQLESRRLSRNLHKIVSSSFPYTILSILVGFIAGGIALLIRRFEINVRARYYFGLSDIVRNRNKYADNGIDGSENPFWATPMRSPLDNLTVSVGLSYRFNKEGFSTWKPRPKREKNREVFKYGL